MILLLILILFTINNPYLLFELKNIYIYINKLKWPQKEKI